jgi:hypothetical protein
MGACLITTITQIDLERIEWAAMDRWKFGHHGGFGSRASAGFHIAILP